MSNTTGSIISSGTNLVNSIFNRRASRENQNRQNQANKELAMYQYLGDRQNWKLQNKYNSPKAQMARLKEAGLNPNLAYGSGNVSGNNASSIGKTQVPRMEYNEQPIQLPDMVNMYQDLRLKQAQIDNVKAGTDNTAQKTANDYLLNKVLFNKITKGKMDIDHQRGLYPYNLNIKKGYVDKQSAEITNLTQMLSNLKSQQSGTRASTNLTNSRTQAQLFENTLLEKGIHKGDNALFRILLQNFDSFQNFLTGGKNKRNGKKININPNVW